MRTQFVHQDETGAVSMSDNEHWPITAPIPLEMEQEMAGPVRNMDALRSRIARSRGLPMRSLREAVVELGLLDTNSLDALTAQAQHTHSALDFFLVESAAVTQLAMEHVHAFMLNTPEVDAASFEVEDAASERLPWLVARSYHVLPLGMESGVLYVASATPFDRQLEHQLSVQADCIVSLVWARIDQIEQRLARQSHSAIQKSGNTPVAAESWSGNSMNPPKDVHSLLSDAIGEMKDVDEDAQSSLGNESSSVIQLVNRMIMDAYEQKVSDIHIETNPGDEISRVRFRKDGDLEDYLMLPASLRAAVVSRLKIMSRLDISERRRPQDGKINFHDFAEIKLELRVAVLPTHDSLEDVVLRLLATSKPIPLQQLGFSARDDRTIKRLMERPFGLILACGPTGSGKTTTLHSLLAYINTDIRKIWTAEDPIEITQKGLRQLQVNTKIGVTFASAMRAFLRADPDVIMIGEVRDAETAAVCIEASLTGHLVLSTLHTNSAAESAVRLLDLGMDPMNFGDSLVGIVAQRLVRALCTHCAIPEVLEQTQWDALVNEYVEGSAIEVEEGRIRLMQSAKEGPHGADDGMRVYRPVGCTLCNGRGYKGRMGIYEVLENTASMKQKIQTRAPTVEIFLEASRSGMRTLRQDALEKVVAGFIDLKQARSLY